MMKTISFTNALFFVCVTRSGEMIRDEGGGVG